VKGQERADVDQPSPNKCYQHSLTSCPRRRGHSKPLTCRLPAVRCASPTDDTGKCSGKNVQSCRSHSATSRVLTPGYTTSDLASTHSTAPSTNVPRSMFYDLASTHLLDTASPSGRSALVYCRRARTLGGNFDHILILSARQICYCRRTESICHCH
jgi:hypothetical protein